MSYILKINGVDHKVSFVGGEKVYDPPLGRDFVRETNRRFRDMVESKRPPNSNTDKEFFSDRGTLADQFADDPESLNDVVSAARKKGYNPHYQDVYMEPLADEPGDPSAFITPSGGRSQVKRVCEEKGLECHGQIEVSRPAWADENAKERLENHRGEI